MACWRIYLFEQASLLAHLSHIYRSVSAIQHLLPIHCTKQSRWKLHYCFYVNIGWDRIIPPNLHPSNEISSRSTRYNSIRIAVSNNKKLRKQYYDIKWEKKSNPEGKVTESAHPARFSPDDKFSRQRVAIKKRFGIYLPDSQLSKPL